MRISFALLTVSLSTLGFTGIASAEDTDALDVSATVVSSCAIQAAPLMFGNIDTLNGSGTNATATLNVACTNGTEAVITLDQGMSSDLDLGSPSNPARRMQNMSGPTGLLRYSLFQDGEQEILWGAYPESGRPYNALSNSTTQLTVYGHVDAGQNVPAGEYEDQVLATISF